MCYWIGLEAVTYLAIIFFLLDVIPSTSTLLLLYIGGSAHYHRFCYMPKQELMGLVEYGSSWNKYLVKFEIHFFRRSTWGLLHYTVHISSLKISHLLSCRIPDKQCDKHTEIHNRFLLRTQNFISCSLLVNQQRVSGISYTVNHHHAGAK